MYSVRQREREAKARLFTEPITLTSFTLDLQATFLLSHTFTHTHAFTLPLWLRGHVLYCLLCVTPCATIFLACNYTTAHYRANTYRKIRIPRNLLIVFRRFHIIIVIMNITCLHRFFFQWRERKTLFLITFQINTSDNVEKITSKHTTPNTSITQLSADNNPRDYHSYLIINQIKLH